MSIETWKKEYIGHHIRPSRFRVLKAAESKYIRALPENLNRHDVETSGRAVCHICFAKECILYDRY